MHHASAAHRIRNLFVDLVCSYLRKCAMVRNPYFDLRSGRNRCCGNGRSDLGHWHKCANGRIVVSMDPIQYPTVEINGEEMELKFRCGDVLRLKREGLDFADMVPKDGQQPTWDQTMERTFKMLAAGLAHTGKGLTSEQLADLVDLGQLREIGGAINE